MRPIQAHPRFHHHGQRPSGRALLAGLLAVVVTACGGGGGGSSAPAPQPPAPTATLNSLAVTPATTSLSRSATKQFTATGSYSDGTTKDLTATVTWASSAPTIASVSSGGLVTGLAAGSATLTAASGATSAQAQVSVTAATLTALTITPASPSLAKGATRQLTAMGAYSDGTSRDLTGSVTWTSSAPAVASVNAAGLVAGVAAGAATISATSGGVTAQTPVTVTAASLLSLAVTPANSSVAKGGTKAFTATGTFSDGSTGPVTVTWTSSAPAVATINGSGVATGIAAGTATLTATNGAISGSATLAVTAATLSSLAITPATPSVTAGASTPLTATGTYTDGSTANLTGTSTWTSSTPAIALVNAGGLVTGVAQGTSTITATSGGVSGSVTLTVNAAATVTLVEVSPTSATVPVTTTKDFQAIVTWSNGTRLNMTYDVQWSSTNTAIATIDNLGQATGLSAGSATIRATYGGVIGQAAITVTAPTLNSISLDPPTSSLSVGGTVDLTATGNFSNGISTVPYDTHVTWTSSSPSVATVESHGVVTAVGAGTATISASAGGVTGTATVTVTAPAPTFDPALVGRWEFIDVTGTWGSFYTFNANGTFDYSLIYLNHDVCINTSKRVATRSGTFSSAPGKIILNITTSFDDVFDCNGNGQRFVFQPSVQEHQASFQNGLLYTNNPNDFTPTGWLGHTKK